MGYFLEELKRRNVFRVGAAYLVVTWIVIQVIETVSDPLGLPPWTEAFFIVLLFAGFPVACIFAWAFEITPDGMKKTVEVDKAESVTASTGRKLDYAIIAALAIALAYFIFERQVLVVQNAEEPIVAAAVSAGTSIAVLPFVDMSSEQDQEYFSDGISEELLNVLASVPDLRVAARTSSFQFKGQNLDISQVAEQLNVQHVLEGSVRKANTTVRITAQLIEADTGFHLWSATYDRELDDIFGIQDEISVAIVDALSETLGLDSGSAPTVAAETNSEAYNAFLLGQHLIKRRTRPTIEAAADHFQRALELDPNYAPAHASLALASYLLTSSGSTYGTLTLEETMAVSEPHIARALELAPDLADVQAVKGLILSANEKIEEAIPYFVRALELNPSHNDARSWYAAALDDLGRITEAFAVMKVAYELDPLSNLTFNNYAAFLMSQRMDNELTTVIERFAAIDPARAATFKANMQNQHRKFADSIATILHAADASPENTRTQAFAALGLAAAGLRDEGLSLWPNPRGQEIFLHPLDHEGFLQASERRFIEEPGDLGALEQVAWANLSAGNNERALEFAARYLEQLGDIRRPIDGANEIFVIDAWQRGDTETMLQYLAPLEANTRSRLAAGEDDSSNHWDLARYLYVRGNLDDALVAMEIALSREVGFFDFVEFGFDVLGMAEHAEFVQVKQDFDAYIASERNKLLRVACGEIGFAIWKPQADTCNEI